MVLSVVFFPFVAALVVVLAGRRSAKLQSCVVTASTALTLALMLLSATFPSDAAITLPVCGLSFVLDGFRSLYGMVVCFMWFVSALLSPQYFKGHHHLSRYYSFFLLTLGATAGVFLSADLLTTFIFFELMSLSSYVWVVQEETPDALDAGKTYLIIAVLGGLVTLMGLFLLQHLTGTLVIAELSSACSAVTNRQLLWAAALCILFGFGAKAGAFPLHIWLPKAHPVAPAPASALLSGVLTKAGLFGILLITVDILPGDENWGLLLLTLGAITMVLGAVIALFSNNLKYVLACSSLSQIGFILVGIAMLCLLGESNGLAAHGTVLYMLNHSLVKLTLFLFAGVVYLNTHALALGEIRGFGRGKPLLHVLFLCGAGSLAGIPGLCGYVSKTLVHESLVEYAAHTGNPVFIGVEWLFLFSGGLTVAYLTKLYVAIFWQKPAPTTHFPAAPWGSPLTATALCLAALPLPLLGLLPHALAEPLAALTLPFTNGHSLHHGVHYLAWINLKGVVISCSIGLLVYCLFVRRVLMDRSGTEPVYLDRWPRWLSLENSVYRPLFALLIRVLSLLARGICELPDALFGLLIRMLSLLARTACDLPDAVLLLLRKTILRDTPIEQPVHRYGLLTRLLSHPGLAPKRADEINTVLEVAGRMSNSLSFALFMMCLGLCIVLVYLIACVF